MTKKEMERDMEMQRRIEREGEGNIHHK